MLISEEINESVTMKFAQAAREMKKSGCRIISLGLGEPDFNAPIHIVEATINAIKNGFDKYSDSMGLIELREAIANKLVRQNGIPAQSSRIIVTPGAKQAIVLTLMALLEPGDEVIDFSPSFVSYLPLVKIAEPQAKVVTINLRQDDFGLDYELFRSAINSKTKIILLNTPNNPTGRMFTKLDLEFIANIAKENNIYIVADEIYELLNFSGLPHYSIGSFAGMDNLCITINGFSKAFAMTGWRIGYLCGPQKVIDTINKLQQHINTNTCTFVQKGAIAALTGSLDHLAIYNMELRKRTNLYGQFLKQQAITGFLPQSTFFAFLDISMTKLASNDFCTKLIKSEGVALTPGIALVQIGIVTCGYHLQQILMYSKRGWS